MSVSLTLRGTLFFSHYFPPSHALVSLSFSSRVLSLRYATSHTVCHWSVIIYAMPWSSFFHLFYLSMPRFFFFHGLFFTHSFTLPRYQSHCFPFVCHYLRHALELFFFFFFSSIIFLFLALSCPPSYAFFYSFRTGDRISETKKVREKMKS